MAGYLAEDNHPLWARVAAASSLAEIGNQHPDLREECLSALSQQLALYREQTPTLNGYLVSYLSDLRAVESASTMAEAYAADSVDLAVQGDWEDTQIRLGLLSERLTPKPAYNPLFDQIFGPFRQAGGQSDPQSPPQESGRVMGPKSKSKIRAMLEAKSKSKSKARAKRKQEKKMRRKQRKRR